MGCTTTSLLSTKPTNEKLEIRIILPIPIFEFALEHKNSSGWHTRLAKKLNIQTLTIKSKEEGPPDEQECVNYENNTNTIIAEKDIPPVYWVHHDEFAELRTRPKKKVE